MHPREYSVVFFPAQDGNYSLRWITRWVNSEFTARVKAEDWVGSMQMADYLCIALELRYVPRHFSSFASSSSFSSTPSYLNPVSIFHSFFFTLSSGKCLPRQLCWIRQLSTTEGDAACFIRTLFPRHRVVRERSTTKSQGNMPHAAQIAGKSVRQNKQEEIEGRSRSMAVKMNETVNFGKINFSYVFNGKYF